MDVVGLHQGAPDRRRKRRWSEHTLCEKSGQILSFVCRKSAMLG